MNDEIKEILKWLQDGVDMIPDYACYGIEISDKDCKILLDYITNLQQENQELNEENEGLKIKLALKQFIKHTELNFCKLEDELEDYKSRVEKAVEYNQQVIKDTKDFYRPTEDIIYSGDTLISIAEKNINILNGRSDE